MATRKKTKKTPWKPKYAPGEATCGELTKPEGWTNELFQVWLRQRTHLARTLVINEARCAPKRFADPDGTLPALEPLPALVNGIAEAAAERNQRLYDQQQKEREAWLARIKEAEEADGKLQRARLEKAIKEREERERQGISK